MTDSFPAAGEKKKIIIEILIIFLNLLFSQDRKDLKFRSTKTNKDKIR